MEGLERFLEAQDSRNSGYETAIREIKYGSAHCLRPRLILSIQSLVRVCGRLSLR